MLSRTLPIAESRETLRALVVVDSVDDARSVVRLLDGNGEFRVSSARNVDDAQQQLDDSSFDVAVIDYALWSDDAAGLMRFVRERHADVAIVLLTNGDNEREALPALKLGAHDFLSKQHLEGGEQLAARMLAAVHEARSLRRRDTMVRWLEREARTDHLTGLFNRRAFDERLHDVCDAARRDSMPVTLVIVDVAGTRTINETYGHDVGDQMIRRAACGILRSIRGGDVAARVGGDDFAIILPEADLDVGRRVARRIAHEVERLNHEEWADQIPVVVTFGVASGVGCDAGELFAACDQQVSAYKSHRRVIAVFPEMEDNDGPSVA